MIAKEIANAVGARVVGDGNVELKWARSVASADEHSLTFVEDAKWLPEALESRAAAVVAGEFAAGPSGKTLLISPQPKLAFARAAALLHPAEKPDGEIHVTAVVDASAKIGRNVTVGPHAVIGTGAVIGNGTIVGANCAVGAGVRIGADCVIKPRVTIYPGAELGDRVIVHSGAVLGSDGFGYVRDRTTGKYEKFPQIGKLVIGSDVEIGANTTIDRGALDETLISDGVKLDNMVHIGHNVRVGRNVVIAAQTGISGSVEILDNVIIGGQVGIGDHVRIEEGVILGSSAGVLPHKVVKGNGIIFWGTPARPLREYLKELAALSRLARK